MYALADTQNPAVSQPIYSVLTQIYNAASTINTNIGSIIYALNTAIGYLSQGTSGGNPGGSSGASPYLRKIYNALYGGLDGTGTDIVDVAMSQMGVGEGRPYYTWYGFDTHVEWCACFVSWCAAQCGYLNTLIPKFAVVDDAAFWYQSRNLWLNRGGTPSPGDIIFFDWDGDNDPDHVGIVANCSGGMVKTVEGNTGDSPGVVSSRSIAVNSSLIYGYGTPDYSAGGSSIYSVLSGIFGKLDDFSNRSLSILSVISSKLDALVGGALGSVSGSSSSSNIPDTYRQLLYLESTGTQFINSQLFYDGTSLQVDARLSYASSSSNQVLFGYWDSGQSSVYAQYLFASGGGPWNIRSGSQWVKSTLDYPFSANKVYNFSMYVGNGRQFASADGLTVCSASYNSGLSTAGKRPFYVFANNDADFNGLGTAFSSCRLYSLRVYMGGKLVRNYFPVSRVADNVLGLYDTVEGVFYGNSGTGSFIAGVPLTSWLDLRINAVLDRLDTIIANQQNDTGLTSCNHHYLAEVSQEPTCALPGLMVYTCDLCGASYSEIMESFGHDWLCTDHVEPVKDADGEIIQSGCDVYTCQICERTYYDYDGTGAPDDESGSSITDLISQLFGKIGSFIGGLLSSVINMLDKLLTGFDNIITSFNEKTQQIVNFGGDYPAWLGGIWSIMPADLQLALGFCVLCLALGIIGKKTVFA